MKNFRFVFLLTLLGTLPTFAADALLPTGSEARKFLLLDTEGQRLGLKDWIGDRAPRKKPLLLLSFWSLSCVPCREEMPRLQAFADKNATQVSLVFINLDTKDQAPAVSERARQLKISATNLLDPYQVTGKNYNVCSAQGSCNVPVLYGISSNGQLVLAHAGYEGPESLDKMLYSALATATSKAATGPTTSVTKSKLALLLEVHQSAPLDAIAARNGMSKQELIQLLKEAEAVVGKSWK